MLPLDLNKLIPKHYLIDIFTLKIFSKELIFNLIVNNLKPEYLIEDNNEFNSCGTYFYYNEDKIKFMRSNSIRKKNHFFVDNINHNLYIKQNDSTASSNKFENNNLFNHNELKSIFNQKIMEVRSKYFEIIDMILYETKSLILTDKLNFARNIIYENYNSPSVKLQFSQNTLNSLEYNNKKISTKKFQQMNYNYIIKEWIKEIDKFLLSNSKNKAQIKTRILMRTKLINAIKFQQSAIIYITVSRTILLIKKYKKYLLKYVDELILDFLQVNIKNNEIKLILENKDSHKITSEYKDIFIRNLKSDEFLQMFMNNKAKYLIIFRFLIKMFNDITKISQDFDDFYTLVFSLSKFSNAT